MPRDFQATIIEPTAYAVFDEDDIYGIYPTLADAEESVITACEAWAYEIMMTEDPMEVVGGHEWEWKWDYKWLVKDALYDFHIKEIPAYKNFL